MSKIFGNLFGGKPQTQVVGEATPFQQAPEFAQQALQTGVSGIQALPVGTFAPSPLTQQQLTGIEQLGQPVSPLTQEQFQAQLGIFQNPFEEQVIQQNIADIRREGTGILSDIGAGATAAGGFGGTRQAVSEGEAQRNILEEIARTSGRERARGFESAADRALGQIGRQTELERRTALDLISGGGILQQQATAEQQAPLAQLQAILAGTGAFPFGGAPVVESERRGALAGVGDIASKFAPFFTGG
jgi:hypothetical protein